MSNSAESWGQIEAAEMIQSLYEGSNSAVDFFRQQMACGYFAMITEHQELTECQELTRPRGLTVCSLLMLWHHCKLADPAHAKYQNMFTTPAPSQIGHATNSANLVVLECCLVAF